MISRLVVAGLTWCGLAMAATITIDSRQGLFTSFAGVETVAITPHVEWEPDHPVNPGDSTDRGAVWISYGDTGYGGSHFQPSEGHSPVVTIFDTFRSGAGMLTLFVWADDTASVRLDGNLLMPAVFTQGICSGQAIGCRPQDAGKISAALSEGEHTLAFALYQVGTGLDTKSNPFGVRFTGTAPAPEELAPEPATWGMFAGGLAVLVLATRRRHNRD